MIEVLEEIKTNRIKSTGYENLHRELLRKFDELMHEQRLNRRDLAARIGVGQAVLTRFFSGDNSPRLRTLFRMAEALNCELEIKIK